VKNVYFFNKKGDCDKKQAKFRAKINEKGFFFATKIISKKPS
jgi:hypothetical protein